MKTGMTRLGGRSPSRTLAVPAVPYLRLAARGGQPVAPAQARGAVPDISELILADHERIRRLLRWDDDTAGYRQDPRCRRARPGGNAGAALAGVHACRAGPGSARIVRGSAAQRRDPHRRPAGPSGCSASDVRRHARRPAGRRPCRDMSTAQTRRGQVPAVAARSAGRTPSPSSPGHIADQRPARGGPARAARSRCGPMPAAISAPWRMWPRLAEHGG